MERLPADKDNSENAWAEMAASAPSFEENLRQNQENSASGLTDIIVSQEKDISSLRAEHPEIYDPSTFDRKEMTDLFNKYIGKLSPDDVKEVVSGGVFDYDKASALLENLLSLRRPPELEVKLVEKKAR